jgi:hypothetical protein
MVRADSLYYLREKLRVTNPFFDEVAGDYFYSFVLECWERRPRCSRSTCRVCGKLSRRPVVMERARTHLYTMLYKIDTRTTR